MNSLSELNAYAAELITFTDLRTPGPSFDRPAAQNQIVNVNQNDDHLVQVGINIVEVIRPTDAYVTYTIDASSHSGAVITWTTIPSGCIVSNPFPGIYTISGIDSAAIWELVKSPIFYPDSEFIGVFSYTGTINWWPLNSKSWTVQVTINDITNLSTPTDMYYNPGVSELVTGNPTVIDNYATTWTVTVTPSDITYITSLSSSGTGGTSSFNNTTKVLTINGTKTQVNSHLNLITYTSPTTATSDYTFRYFAVNDTTNEGDIKTQQWISASYLSATRANDSYTVNTTASITNGPLITDVGYDGSGAYILDIVPSVTAAVSTMTSTGRYEWTLIDEFNNPNPNTLDYHGGSFDLSNDNKVMAVGSSFDDTLNSNQGRQDGRVYVYYSSDLSWDQGVVPFGQIGGATGVGFGNNIALNNDGTTIAIASLEQNLAGTTGSYGSGKYYIYTRSGTTLSLQATITPTESESVPLSVGAGKLSSDGNTLAFLLRSPSTVAYILIYTRSGSTWTKEAKVSPSDYSGSWMNFGTSIDLSDDGNTLAVGADAHTHASITNSGAVYVFSRSGSTWTQQQELQASDVIANKKFGSYLRLSADGNSLFVTASGAAGVSPQEYIFTRSGSTWTQQYNWTTTFTLGQRIAISKDLLTIINFSTYKVYTRSAGVCTESGILPSAQMVYPLTNFIVSNNSNFILGTNPAANSNFGGALIFNKQTVGKEFSSSIKRLRLTGTRSQINTDIDTIQLTPAAGYVSDITLTYTVITPRSATDSRTQLITYTP